MDHNTDADMETAYWGESVVKGAVGAYHGANASAKDLQKNLKETKTDLDKAMAVLSVVHNQQIKDHDELSTKVNEGITKIGEAITAIERAQSLAADAAKSK